MEEHHKSILNSFAPKRIIWPILIGLGVASFLLIRNFDTQAFENIRWTSSTAFWIVMSLLMVAVRDLAYMYRIRVLTDSSLTWKSCFNVVFLWEFASALAPPALGGGFAFAIFIITGEKIKMGKSIAVVLFTSLLDGLFFALVAPLVYFMAGRDSIFSGIDPMSLNKIAHGEGLFVSFWIIYFIILAYKLLVVYALFINARAVKWLLLKIFALPVLRRWRHKVRETGDEMIIASLELQNQTVAYWIKSFAATFMSWTARFVIINCLIMAFHQVEVSHFILYARQVIMGILMIGSPTPGGSGVAELIFSNFLGEFIPNGLAPTLALLWRLISYYPYLFIGAVLLPRWLKKVFAHPGKTDKTDQPV